MGVERVESENEALPPAAAALARGPVPVPGGSETRLERLRSFVQLMTSGSAAFALAAGIGALIFNDPASGFASAIGLVHVAWLQLVVRAELRGGRVQRGVGAIGIGLLVASGLLVIVTPEVAPAAVIVPLLAVGIGLPFLDQRSLLRLMIGTAIAVTLIGVGAEIAPRLSRLPSPVLGTARLAGVVLATSMVMLLLWEFSRRLREVLGRMAMANDAMRAAEERVVAVNEELRHRVDELELRSREMAQLAKMGDLLQACETSDEAYAVIAQTAGPLFSGDGGALFELTATRNAVESVAAWGEPTGSKPVFAPTECWALRRGRPYLLEDAATEIICPHVDADSSSYLCVPLIAQSDSLGLLHLQLRSRGSRPQRREQMLERQRLAVTLGEHLSLALANFRLRASLRERSTRDELTGLFNRRFLEEALDREIRRAVREHRPLGLMMIDLDHFKRVNDTFGHAAGDFVLRLVGDYLQSNVRAEDIACRYGGEEFVILMPKASAEDTERRAEALRAAIADVRPVQGTSRFPAISLSIGVASYPEHGSTGEAVLRAADAALYRAKAAGRDRVASATPLGAGAVTPAP